MPDTLLRFPDDNPFSNMVSERAEKITITPDRAAWLLENFNHKNRPIPERNVGHLTSQIEAGRWIVTGETLIFSRPPVFLLNGQCRLTACVRSKIPITIWVVFGIEPRAFQAMDRGKTRSTSDDLAILGETKTRALSAAAALLWLDDRGEIEKIGKVPPTEDVQAILKAHPRIRDAVLYSQTHGRNVPLQGRITAFCLYRFREKDAIAAEVFFRDLISGANLNLNDPILKLRNRLMEIRNSKSTLNPVVLLALTIKAWNHRRRGTTPRILSWRTDGASPEPFPAIE